MSTLNISLPDAMRQYVEQQAAEGDFTASEYVRHLIRMDQERKTLERRAKIAQYLALCQQQIDNGQCAEFNMDEVIAAGEAEYKRRHKKKKS